MVTKTHIPEIVSQERGSSAWGSSFDLQRIFKRSHTDTIFHIPWWSNTE